MSHLRLFNVKTWGQPASTTCCSKGCFTCVGYSMALDEAFHMEFATMPRASP